jgi:hypothetical protein
MTGPAWAALLVGLIVFWPATCELTRLGRRVRARRDIRRLEHPADHPRYSHTPARKETPQS